ncbi:Serine/threonine protein kinase [Mycobacterium sp. 012931]|nr:Serine/threonine protein kinase [Mycobacterium sp. 012931]
MYLAQHPRLPRRDALKILPAEFTSSQEFRQRFNREADLAATLYNQHIVGIHDRGEFHGQLWISMDYVEGTDAARLLNTQYPTGMPYAEVVEIIAAAGLPRASARHRRQSQPFSCLTTSPTSRRY